MSDPPGPAWLGIGAQRSGTAWLTRLLLQHPGMDLGTNGKKEQQALHWVAQGSMTDQEYVDLFPDDGRRRGEWTPRYLHTMSVPLTAMRLVRPDAPILVILRDPVERFASGMRLAATRRRSGPYEAQLAYAHLSGLYLDNLDVWGSVFGKERIVALTYEAAVADPDGVCARVWRRLGLSPVALAGVDEPSRTSTQGGRWDWPDGLREMLVRLYRRQLPGLRDDWGVEVERWRSFAT